PHRHPRFDEFERGASDLLLLREVAFGGEVEIELLRTRPAAQGRPAVDLIEAALRREALQVPADRHAGDVELLGEGRYRDRAPPSDLFQDSAAAFVNEHGPSRGRLGCLEE